MNDNFDKLKLSLNSLDTITKNIGSQTFKAKNAIPTVKSDGRNIMIGECFVANGTA